MWPCGARGPTRRCSVRSPTDPVRDLVRVRWVGAAESAPPDRAAAHARGRPMRSRSHLGRSQDWSRFAARRAGRRERGRRAAAPGSGRRRRRRHPGGGRADRADPDPRVPLAAIAQRTGVSYEALKKPRQRREAAVAAWLTRDRRRTVACSPEPTAHRSPTRSAQTRRHHDQAAPRVRAHAGGTIAPGPAGGTRVVGPDERRFRPDGTVRKAAMDRDERAVDPPDSP
jgi:hypothetical protein